MIIFSNNWRRHYWEKNRTVVILCWNITSKFHSDRKNDRKNENLEICITVWFEQLNESRIKTVFEYCYWIEWTSMQNTRFVENYFMLPYICLWLRPMIKQLPEKLEFMRTFNFSCLRNEEVSSSQKNSKMFWYCRYV